MHTLHLKSNYIDNVIITLIFFLLFCFDESAEYIGLVYVGFLGVGALCVYQLMKHNGEIKIPFAFLLLLFFYAWCLIGAFFNSQIIDSIVGRLFTLALLYCVMLLLYNYIQYKRNLDDVLFCMFVAGTLFSFYVVGTCGGLLSYLQGVFLGRRMGGEIANVNSIGLNLCFAYAAGCYTLIKRKVVSLGLLFLPIVLVAAGTGSRKVLLFLAGFTALFIYFYIKLTTSKNSISRYKKYLSVFLVAVAATMLLASTGIFDTAFERFENMFKVSSAGVIADNSANTRANMIKIGLHAFSEKPVFGYGLTGSGGITQHYLGWETYLHNNYVEILASSGIIGFLFYYGFYGCLFVKILRKMKNRNLLCVFGFSTLFIQLVLEVALVSYYSKRLAILTAVWMFIASSSQVE